MFIRENNPATLPNLPQDSGTQSNWDPSTISNLVFGSIMVFVGMIAIWQGRHRRVVAMDEELAIIRPLHGSMSLWDHPYIRPDTAIQLPAPPLMLHDTSTASSSIAQLALANNENNKCGQPVADNHVFIPTISTRVTTLSTMGSVENSTARRANDLTPGLDITEVEDSANITETLGHQGTEPEEMT